MWETNGHTCSGREHGKGVPIESVSDILERELPVVIQDWLARVEKESDLTCIPLTFEERTGHLPQLLLDVVARLRLGAGSKALVSDAVGIHGDLRRKQGYTLAMAVQESRLLQVTIFSMLHNNLKRLDFNTLLPDVVTIADEVDAQTDTADAAVHGRLAFRWQHHAGPLALGIGPVRTSTRIQHHPY